MAAVIDSISDYSMFDNQPSRVSSIIKEDTSTEIGNELIWISLDDIIDSSNN